MSTKIAQRHCRKCGPTLAQKPIPNHILHLLISVFTCGLWVIVWGILIAGCAGDYYYCSHCGEAC